MSSLKLFLLLFFAVFIDKLNVEGQDNKFKSLFIYNFTKYIEWPSENQGLEFIITVYGNSGVAAELQNVCAKAKANNKPIIVKQIDNLLEIKTTHILFIGKEKTAELANNLSNLTSKSVLIISEKPSACSIGSSINFVNKNGNLSFEISPSNLLKANLKVNSQLLSLGTVVH